MPPIIKDPTQAICPNFEGPEWTFLRQCIIGSHPGKIPLTTEEAARQMREAWTQDNDARITAWNAQFEKDRAEQAKQDKQAREAKEAERAQLEKEAEEQRRAAERSKPKLNSFDPTRHVSAWIPPRPAAYALEKINNLEYVELDYFTALRPSKNIRKDEELSWEEMLEAKNTMLHFMAQSGLWPKAHADSLVAFYVALERHPRRLMANGKTTLLLYQDRVRREWFHALECNEGFNIALISDCLIRNMADEVRDKIWQREIDQVRISWAPDRKLALTSTSPHSPLHASVLFAVARPNSCYLFCFIPMHVCTRFAD
jgi:hypothetical protein